MNYFKRFGIVAMCVPIGVMALLFITYIVCTSNPYPSQIDPSFVDSKQKKYAETVGFALNHPVWITTLHGYSERNSAGAGHARRPATGASPLLTKDFVIIPCSGYDIHVLNARTGDEFFKIEFPFKQYILDDLFYAKGRIFGRLYPGIIFAISLETRSLVWRTTLEGRFFVKGDELLVVSGAEITRISQSSGTVIGKIPLSENFGDCPSIVSTDRYLIVADNKNIWCLDMTNWSVLWKEHVIDHDLSYVSEPVINGEFVYIATYHTDDKTKSISGTGITRVFSLLSGKRAGDINGIYSPYPPLMIGRNVIHWDNKEVVATDIASGKPLWMQGGIDGYPGFPHVFNNNLYLLGENRIYCLSLETGAIIQKSGEPVCDFNAQINYMTANKNGLLIFDDQTTVKFYAPLDQIGTVRQESEPRPIGDKSERETK